MTKFILPRDFKPDFEKEYQHGEITFRIAVQRMDVPAEGSPLLLWNFAIFVGDRLVEAGPFHWDAAERPLTEESVCNHLASFYMDSPQVREGRPLEQSEPPEVPHDRNFLAKAAALVWTLYYSDVEGESYPIEDLLVDSYTDLGDMKCALISNKHNPGMVYEVEYNGIEKKTTVVSYIETDRTVINDDEL